MILNQIQMMYSNEDKEDNTSRFMQRVGKFVNENSFIE